MKKSVIFALIMGMFCGNADAHFGIAIIDSHKLSEVKIEHIGETKDALLKLAEENPCQIFLKLLRNYVKYDLIPSAGVREVELENPKDGNICGFEPCDIQNKNHEFMVTQTFCTEYFNDQNAAPDNDQNTAPETKKLHLTLAPYSEDIQTALNGYTVVSCSIGLPADEIKGIKEKVHFCCFSLNNNAKPNDVGDVILAEDFSKDIFFVVGRNPRSSDDSGLLFYFSDLYGQNKKKLPLFVEENFFMQYVDKKEKHKISKGNSMACPRFAAKLTKTLDRLAKTPDSPILEISVQDVKKHIQPYNIEFLPNNENGWNFNLKCGSDFVEENSLSRKNLFINLFGSIPEEAERILEMEEKPEEAKFVFFNKKILGEKEKAIPIVKSIVKELFKRSLMIKPISKEKENGSEKEQLLSSYLKEFWSLFRGGISDDVKHVVECAFNTFFAKEKDQIASPAVFLSKWTQTWQQKIDEQQKKLIELLEKRKNSLKIKYCDSDNCGEDYFMHMMSMVRCTSKIDSTVQNIREMQKCRDILSRKIQCRIPELAWLCLDTGSLDSKIQSDIIEPSFPTSQEELNNRIEILHEFVKNKNAEKYFPTVMCAFENKENNKLLKSPDNWKSFIEDFKNELTCFDRVKESETGSSKLLGLFDSALDNETIDDKINTVKVVGSKIVFSDKAEDEYSQEGLERIVKILDQSLIAAYLSHHHGKIIKMYEADPSSVDCVKVKEGKEEELKKAVSDFQPLANLMLRPLRGKMDWEGFEKEQEEKATKQ